ncbi:hypothetical protein [Streptomyces sp. DSM 118148]|uniref:hypothetical protein n=1 Tax=Streptomyces sp. DSM 118148 TaxID=3448667 RepID=UPI0040401817
MGTSPSYQFWITDPEPIEGTSDRKSVVVSLVPASYPHLVVRWQYTLREDRLVEGPYGVQVQPHPGLAAKNWLTVGATVVRDLPLTKLERAARFMLQVSLKAPDGAPLSGRLAAFGPDPEDIPATARETVRERHPDVDPEAGPAALRRWNRLTRLAEVWLEYHAAQAKGEKAPTTVIAEARGVAPATVRTWLHHAKQEGLDTSFAPEFAIVATTNASPLEG